MNARNFVGVAVPAFAVILIATGAFGQTQPATHGPAEGGSPAWFLQGSFPDPGGNTVVDPDGRVTVPPRTGGAPRPAAATTPTETSLPPTPGCSRSPVCGNRLTPGRQTLQRVQWEQTLGYTFTYPYVLPSGAGGVPAVALDSKGNLWAFQRKAAGSPQLYKFDPDHKLVLQIGDDVIGHQDKAHGMAVDAEDNVWISDANGATVMKLSPRGELLMTIGVRGRRGDWNEAKGQRLLWQPVMIAFGQDGDVYIGEGHANESPNDTDSDDPANNLGAARVIHLDKTGKFINQWYGNNVGQGKFESVHGLAIDPTNGDAWIGDREQYRIVVYSGEGRFIRTMQMRNLVCALHFDSRGNPWMASGQDGQFLKLDRNGKVLGAIGNGMGIGPGQFIEASYWVFDKQDNLYAGDTSVGRITKMIAQNKTAETPGTAIVIPSADMQTKLRQMIEQKVQDDSVRVVNTGDSNLAVFFIHLNPGQTPQEPIQLMSHDDVTEVYYVLKGEGTLYHGGTIQNPTPRDLATTGGPSKGGPANGKLTQNVAAGDVFIVPANTPHQVNLGAKTEMVYLVVRVDPKKHLQLK